MKSQIEWQRAIMRNWNALSLSHAKEIAHFVQVAESAAVAEEREAVLKACNSMLKTTAKCEDTDYWWGYIAALKDALDYIRSRASGGNGGGEEDSDG